VISAALSYDQHFGTSEVELFIGQSLEYTEREMIDFLLDAFDAFDVSFAVISSTLNSNRGSISHERTSRVN
jgi:hypothetical protein